MTLLSRRGLLGSLLAAPAIIRTPGLLMPVKPLLNSIYVEGPAFVSGVSISSGWTIKTSRIISEAEVLQVFIKPNPFFPMFK